MYLKKKYCLHRTEFHKEAYFFLALNYVDKCYISFNSLHSRNADIAGGKIQLLPLLYEENDLFILLVKSTE